MIKYSHGVALGPLQRANLELYRGARNTPAIMRWCRQKSLVDEAQQAKWFEAQSADPTIEMFEVVAGTGLSVGVCGFTDIDHHCQRAEFSLYLFPDMQGLGFAEPALRTLVKFGFDELNLNMIWGETVGDNKAQGIFEEVGFEKTGMRPCFYYKDGNFQHSYIYCLLRDNWRVSS